VKPRRTVDIRAAAIGLLAAALLVFTLSRSVESAAAAEKQLLVVSDIHFDPMAEPQLIDRLAAAEPANWQTIFESTRNRRPSGYGKDTNWPLLASALRQMRETLPQPAFLLLPGDFLAHQFRNKFNAGARDHSDPAYRDFVRKTMRFLALQLERTFPDTPILPVLGNNDEECGDYELQPTGPFLADTLPILRGLLGNAGREPGFEREWTSYGNAAVTVQGLRVLLIDTVVFSGNYRNACGSPGDGDAGRMTLAWVEAQLAAARRAHQRVWLAYHIPLGIDGYATWRQGSCPGHVLPMWDDRYARPFYDLTRRYADTIAASFAGHTHMDDFRLVGEGSRYFGFAVITPALSPIFGQNPAYRAVVFDNAGALLDQTTYDLTNLSATGPDIAAKWRPEYTFTREWRLPSIDLPSLEKLYTRITTVPGDRERWHTLFPVSSPVYWTLNHGGADEIRAYDCATGHVSVTDFQQCDCGVIR
jgi:sphingomyelin phosphodiesterase acid-like 3